MNNQELDILKKLFSCSSEYVIIMNHDFEILWQNQNDKYEIINSNNLRLIFEREKKPLDSKEYFFSVGGIEFPCRIINYTESGLYVLQTSGEDTMFSYMRSSAVRHFFSNQIAQIRDNITGISTAVTFIRNALDEKNLELIDKYLNIAIGKCRIILKASANPGELIKYTENDPEPTAIDLTSFLKKFQSICSNILKNQIQINLTAAPCLCIFAGPSRFTVCMLSLLILAGESTSNCGKIFIDAKKTGNYVSIKVSPGSKEKMPSSGTFSKFEKLYQEDEANPGLFIVYRFCRSYNGTLFIANNKHNEGKTYSIKLPYFKNTDHNTELYSEQISYPNDMFSIYNIFLSEIAEII